MDDPIFVDTNVFLRFFVRDVESFYQKARELFEKAERGDAKLETSDIVIAEIVWVLESYYDFSKAEIKEVVDTILETKNIRIANHSRAKEAINNYFDVKHFKNIEGLTNIW